METSENNYWTSVGQYLSCPSRCGKEWHELRSIRGLWWLRATDCESGEVLYDGWEDDREEVTHQEGE